MPYAGTAAAITDILTNVVVVGSTGTTDVDARAGVLALLKKVVAEYALAHYWPELNKNAAISFDSAGLAPVPVDFLSWRQNRGWIDFTSPFNRLVPVHEEYVTALRADDATGRAAQPTHVAREGSNMICYPRPSVAPLAGTAYYRMQAPTLTDADPGNLLVAMDDSRHDTVLIEGARWAHYVDAGDGRAQEQYQLFLKAMADAWRTISQDTAPRRWGRGYLGRVLRGVRYPSWLQGYTP